MTGINDSAPVPSGTDMHAAAVWAWRGNDEAVVDYVAGRIPADRSSKIAIAGGRTPGPILERLKTRALPWNRARFLPTDERLVHPTHPDSNYGALSRALDGTPALIEPLQDADAKDDFDLVWLGMAEDGKIASLFTTSDTEVKGGASIIRTRPVAGSSHVPYQRQTLSLDTICRARDLILVIRGLQKRRVVEDALAGVSDLAVSRLFRATRMPVRIFWCR